jgi:hypothetical protein
MQKFIRIPEPRRNKYEIIILRKTSIFGKIISEIIFEASGGDKPRRQRFDMTTHMTRLEMTLLGVTPINTA